MYIAVLWIVGFISLWIGLKSEIPRRSLFSFSYITLLLWHSLFLFTISDTIDLYGAESVQQMLVFVIVGVFTLLITRRLLSKNWLYENDELNVSIRHQFFIQSTTNRWLLPLLAICSLGIYMIYDPTALFTRLGDRVIHASAFLSSISVMFGLLYASNLGLMAKFKSASTWLIWTPILWLIMVLVGGRVVVYTTAGAFLARWIKSTTDSNPTITKKMVGTAFIGYVSGVLLRDLRGIGVSDVGDHILSGNYFANLNWQSSESTIYVYFCHSIFWGWRSIAVFPGQSLLRILALGGKVFGQNLFSGPLDQLLDLTQMLWIHINLLGNNIKDTLDYPGSIPPMIYGEGYLNGGLIGMIVFIFVVTYCFTKIECVIDQKGGRNSDYVSLYGILFTALLYTMRGTIYWATVNLLFCYVAWTVIVFGRRFFAKLFS